MLLYFICVAHVCTLLEPLQNTCVDRLPAKPQDSSVSSELMRRRVMQPNHPGQTSLQAKAPQQPLSVHHHLQRLPTCMLAGGLAAAISVICALLPRVPTVWTWLRLWVLVGLRTPLLFRWRH